MPEKKKRIRRPKHTTEEIKEKIEERGFELLTKEYYGSKQLLTVKCKECGKNSRTCYNNFYRMSGCKHCYKIKKIAEGPMRKITLRDGLFNMTEAAQILRVDYADFRKHVVEWQTLPAPSRQCGVRKYFSQEDLEKIEEMIV